MCKACLTRALVVLCSTDTTTTPCGARAFQHAPTSPLNKTPLFGAAQVSAHYGEWKQDYEYISETAQWLALKEHVSTIDRTHLRVRAALASLPASLYWPPKVTPLQQPY